MAITGQDGKEAPTSRKPEPSTHSHIRARSEAEAAAWASKRRKKGLLHLLTMPEIMECVGAFEWRRANALTETEFFYVKATALSGTCYQHWAERRRVLIGKQVTYRVRYIQILGDALWAHNGPGPEDRDGSLSPVRQLYPASPQPTTSARERPLEEDGSPSPHNNNL